MTQECSSVSSHSRDALQGVHSHPARRNHIEFEDEFTETGAQACNWVTTGQVVIRTQSCGACQHLPHLQSILGQRRGITHRENVH